MGFFQSAIFLYLLCATGQGLGIQKRFLMDSPADLYRNNCDCYSSNCDCVNGHCKHLLHNYITHTDIYRCECYIGWTGETCNIPDNSYIQNCDCGKDYHSCDCDNGRCKHISYDHDTHTIAYRCECELGWTGETCNKLVTAETAPHYSTNSVHTTAAATTKPTTPTTTQSQSSTLTMTSSTTATSLAFVSSPTTSSTSVSSMASETTTANIATTSSAVEQHTTSVGTTAHATATMLPTGTTMDQTNTSLAGIPSCDKFGLLNDLAKQISLSHQAAGNCSSANRTPSAAVLLLHCAVPLSPQMWKPGINVRHECQNDAHFPTYLPIATFHAGVYTHDQDVSGIFLGCVNGGLKIAMQDCNDSLHVKEITDGSGPLDPSLFYTISLPMASSDGQTQTQAVTSSPTTAPTTSTSRNIIITVKPVTTTTTRTTVRTTTASTTAEEATETTTKPTSTFFPTNTAPHFNTNSIQTTETSETTLPTLTTTTSPPHYTTMASSTEASMSVPVLSSISVSSERHTSSARTTITTQPRQITTQQTSVTSSAGAPNCHVSEFLLDLLHQVILSHPAAGNCSSANGTQSAAVPLVHCAVPQNPLLWQQGYNVFKGCQNGGTVPRYSPIATFGGGVYSHDLDVSGIFIGCIENGFEIGLQRCDGGLRTENVTDGSGSVHPSLFYTISFTKVFSDGQTQTQAVTTPPTTASTTTTNTTRKILITVKPVTTATSTTATTTASATVAAVTATTTRPTSTAFSNNTALHLSTDNNQTTETSTSTSPSSATPASQSDNSTMANSIQASTPVPVSSSMSSSEQHTSSSTTTTFPREESTANTSLTSTGDTTTMTDQPVAVQTTTHKNPYTIPPKTTNCAKCAGPDILCEKLYEVQPCDPPNNYCVNKVINHADGTRSVTRGCGNFDTCYTDWFFGSSDVDKCRLFDENNFITLKFDCTFCCIKDGCNVPLKPAGDTMYKDL